MPQELGGRTWETVYGSTRVLCGPGTLERVGELARDLGIQRVLLVTDPAMREAGHVDRGLAALDGAGIAVTIHDRVRPNPTAEDVDLALAAAREAGIDGLLALGGGSVMDCAKGVNFVLTNGGRIHDYRGTGLARRAMLPSLAVPSTAGTGSEAQSYAVIADPTTGAKMACGDKKAMFRAVALDPLVAATAPPEVAGPAGIDALAHAVESHVSTRANPISRLFSRDAWRRLEAHVTTALSGKAGPAVWSEMQVGAFFAGAAIEHAMLGAAHACANPLTARYPVAHGAAVGLMLPHVVRFNADSVGEGYGELVESSDPRSAAAALERRLREIATLARLPHSLRDLEVPREVLPQLAADAATQWTGGFNPRRVSERDFLELYEAAW